MKKVAENPILSHFLLFPSSYDSQKKGVRPPPHSPLYMRKAPLSESLPLLQMNCD